MARVLVAWCPDWRVAAAGYPPSVPVAVVAANRVVATSVAARAEGVECGLRRREAQGRCPSLEVVAADAAREARAWEPVVAAVEALAPGVEVLRPGALALGARGPSRYFGGDAALGARVAATVDAVAVGGPSSPLTARPACRVGVAGGRFAAELAAREARGVVEVVPPGTDRAWLAGLPVSTLGRPDLAGLLGRLGVGVLGDLARLPAPSVLARFGLEGAAAQRLARGLDEQPLAARAPPLELAVVAKLDPPADRVDTAAFVAKALADQLHAQLATLGLACTRLAIEAETERGERLSRLWRHDGALTAAAVAERVRWQLDGWLSASGGLSGGLTLLRLVPDEVRPDQGRQLGFWGGSAGADARAGRALARVQALLGPDAVATAVVVGGRGPVEQARLVTWGEPREPPPPVGAPPWPGRLPGPAPALVHQPPLPARLLDRAGLEVAVTGRGAFSAAPAVLSFAAGRQEEVAAWAGPWPVEERWWDEGGRRQARFQVVLAGGTAHLVAREGGQWWVTATYD